MRLPKHIGIIPDGNRRWALGQNMEKEDGYIHGIAPGMTLYRMCREMGIEEMTFYGFTVDNTCLLYTSVSAISEGDGQYVIDADTCIDCGTCAATCPTGAISEG